MTGIRVEDVEGVEDEGTSGEPSAGEPSLAYIPALDGVRAVAVLGVLAFHSGIPFLPAGFLGVDAFFVLSGFLITSLLLAEWRHRGTVRLRAFWARRARRLLPALFLVVVFVVCFATLVAPRGAYPGLRGDALAALFYVANWHFIVAGSNYFAQTGATSPLTHTWSLAIEEQFYVVWPLLALGLLKLFRRLRPLLVVAVAGAVCSAAEMFVLARHGADPTRLYYGTDTHAQSLLVGVALAVVLAMAASARRADPGRGRRLGGGPGWAPSTGWPRTTVALVGVAGLAVDGVLWWRASYVGGFLWQGGFVLADVGTAAVLLSVVSLPGGRLAAVLSAPPLRFVGRISYGMYLWHFPLFLWVDGARTGLTGYPLFGARLAVTTAVATLSYVAVEQPIRRGGLLRRWRAWVGAPVAAGGVVAFVVVATVSAGVAAPASLPQGTLPGGGAGRAPVGVPVRTVLLVGDSTAATLGKDLGLEADRYGVTLVNKSLLGCGVAEITQVVAGGHDWKVAPQCNPRSPAQDRWPALWRRWLTRYRPSIVAILAGRWEVSNVRWRGRWTNIGSSAFRRYVARQLDLAVGIASSQGAHVDLLTAPCYGRAEQPDGTVSPADTPRRLDVYNGLVRAVAAAHPSTVTLVDLDAVVCPGGRYRESIGTVTVRTPDGVHFPYFSNAHPRSPDPDTVAQVVAFGRWIGPRLWPKLLAEPTTARRG